LRALLEKEEEKEKENSVASLFSSVNLITTSRVTELR
jgi:hypothetical protein